MTGVPLRVSLLVCMCVAAAMGRIVEVERVRPDVSVAQGQFGQRVLQLGNTTLVGAYRENANEGAAYVFAAGNGETGWTQVERLAGGSAADDEFGSALAMTAERAAVGARQSTVGVGFVLVYDRSLPWSQLPVQVVPTIGPINVDDRFGTAVGLTSTLLIVAAPLDDAAGANAGCVRTFLSVGSMWPEQTKLFAVDAAANDVFGGALSVSRNLLLVGARVADDVGAAYLFEWVIDDWTPLTRLTSPDALTDGRFGSAVALYGLQMAIGADPLQGPPPAGPGAAYSFDCQQSAEATSDVADRLAVPTVTEERVGQTVAIGDNLLVVGAPGLVHGSIFVFVRHVAQDAQWELHATVTSPNDGSDFAGSLAVAGDLIWVGAEHTADNKGEVILYRYVADDPLPRRSWWLWLLIGGGVGVGAAALMVMRVRGRGEGSSKGDSEDRLSEADRRMLDFSDPETNRRVSIASGTSVATTATLHSVASTE